MGNRQWGGELEWKGNRRLGIVVVYIDIRKRVEDTARRAKDRGKGTRPEKKADGLDISGRSKSEY